MILVWSNIQKGSSMDPVPKLHICLKNSIFRLKRYLDKNIYLLYNLIVRLRNYV